MGYAIQCICLNIARTCYEGLKPMTQMDLLMDNCIHLYIHPTIDPTTDPMIDSIIDSTIDSTNGIWVSYE